MKPQTRKFLRFFTKLFLAILGIVFLLILTLATFFLIANKTNGSIVSSGQRRFYLLHVPSTYNPDEPTPLVISLHGYAEWPAHQARLSHWNELSEEYGFIVVYPSGTSFPKRWRSSGFTESSYDPMVDVQFISDLIDTLATQYNIDNDHIYANGLSNGGGMSYLLACKLSDRIAAVGSVAGAYTFPASQCNPSRPVPLIAFHGTSDPIVPYTGGPSHSFDIDFPMVTAFIQDWAERNQCSSQPETLDTSGEVSGIRYTGCEQNAEVLFYTIDGGGHSWPGGHPLPAWIVGYTTQQVDASRLMWDFFEQHPLPAK